MADQDHVSRFLGSVEEWNRWRDEEHSIPDLAGADLSGAIVPGANLTGADLSDSNLARAQLVDANIAGADLSRAFLDGARLHGADLTRANLTRAVLNSSNVTSANLTGARLVDATFANAKLSDSNFTGADLSDASLRHAELIDACFVDAILDHTNFDGAILSGADFTRANLTGAHLTYANLIRADLTGANLSGANLTRADLSDANLTGAILSHADILDVNLSRACLVEANLAEAFIGGTALADLDLSQTLGLERLQHLGPSSVGIDTFLRSTRQLPDVFLRGAGVPEAFITYARSLVVSPIEFYSCFISYSHADRSFARRLIDALQGRGVRCWLDEKQVLDGDDIHDAVDRGIRLWDKVLLCCSEASLTSWWVDNEIDKAFTKEQALMNERKTKVGALIPLNLDGYLFSGRWTSGKASQVTSRLAADFTGWATDNGRFDDAFERLVSALRADQAAREPPPPPKL